jgi:predicted metalloprotease
MKLSLPGSRSRNLEDRRGGGGRSGGMGLPIGLGAGLGLPGAIIVLALLLFGGNIFGGGGGSGSNVDDPFREFPGASSGGQPIPAANDPDAEIVDFVSAVLDDVQGVWAEQFEAAGNAYDPATLVLFDEATQSGCGPASSATGPFYCSLDETVYLDLSFFNDLRARFGAPGDFAQAYVIAHEIAHHVQQQAGISDEVRRAAQDDPDQANELSVRQELQADCLSGVWGFTANQRGILEAGDLEEGLGAAAAIGDDRLQRQAGGRVNPETWTHGSSEQRVEWFRRGFESGDPGRCDTFGGDI